MGFTIFCDCDDTLWPSYQRYTEADERLAHLAAEATGRTVEDCRREIGVVGCIRMSGGLPGWLGKAATVLANLGGDTPSALAEAARISDWLAAAPALHCGVLGALESARRLGAGLAFLTCGEAEQRLKLSRLAATGVDLESYGPLRVVPAKTLEAHRRFRDDAAPGRRTAFIGDSVVNDLRPALAARHELVVRVVTAHHWPPCDDPPGAEEESLWLSADTFHRAVEKSLEVAEKEGWL